MEIRGLSETDAEAFWRLRLRALREHPEAFAGAYEEARDRPLASVAEELRTRYTGKESVVLGAVERDELIGMIGCFRHVGAKRRHKAMIWGMYVVPDARGRGVGRALLDAAVDRARAWTGVEQVMLGVVTANVAARALYREAGFRVYGVEPRSLAVGDRYLDEELMVLPLEDTDADR